MERMRRLRSEDGPMLVSHGSATLSLFCMILLAACSAPPAQERPATADAMPLPAGSEIAVKAALAAYPGAVLDDSDVSGRSLGLGGQCDTIWSLHLRVNG